MKNNTHNTTCAVFFLIVFMATICSTAENTPSSATWSKPIELTLPSKSGPIKAVSQTCPFQWKDAKGMDNRNISMIVLVPTKKLLWMGFCYDHFFIMEDKIVGLSQVWGSDLYINVSDIKVQSSELTSPVLAKELKDFLHKIAASLSHPSNPDAWGVSQDSFHGERIDLGPILGGVAFRKKGDTGLATAKITRIAFEGLNVVITFEGENGVKASVSFNQKMEPVTATLNDKKVFENSKMLLQGDAEIDKKSAALKLVSAAEEGDLGMVQELLTKGTNSINVTSETGYTALMYAAEEGNIEIAKLLVSKGADVNAKNKEDDGCTPFMYAARAGNVEVAQILLAKGADMKAKDDEGRDAMTWAIKDGHKAFVDFLIAKGWKLDKITEDYMISKGWKVNEKK